MSKQEMHINCLELKVAFLALQFLVKDRTRILVLLQLNSQTAVSYINHFGRDSLSPTLRSGERSMAVGPLQGPGVDSSTHSRCSQSNSRFKSPES